MSGRRVGQRARTGSREPRNAKEDQGREGGHRKAHTDTRDGHTVDDGGPVCVEMHGMREMHARKGA